MSCVVYRVLETRSLPVWTAMIVYPMTRSGINMTPVRTAVELSTETAAHYGRVFLIIGRSGPIDDPNDNSSNGCYHHQRSPICKGYCWRILSATSTLA